LAIADGRLTGQSMTRIAAGIGKHTSTVSREIATRMSVVT
jgi:IS30 family transposase